jgi:opacity protein-like surface antigen
MTVSASAYEAYAGGFEIVPLVGYTAGGTFEDEVTGAQLDVRSNANYGLMLDINQAADSQVELYYSRQPTQLRANGGAFVGDPLFDLDIHYLHIGGTYTEATGKVKPYVVGTIGATLMDPKGEDLHSETKLSLSLGGGVKIPLTDRLGLRLEGRWFGTFFGNSGAVFCVNGACAVSIQGSVFMQLAANVGLMIAF